MTKVRIWLFSPPCGGWQGNRCISRIELLGIVSTFPHPVDWFGLMRHVRIGPHVWRESLTEVTCLPVVITSGPPTLRFLNYQKFTAPPVVCWGLLVVVFSNPGFLNLGAVDIGRGILLSAGLCPVHCWIFSSIPALGPLNAAATFIPEKG